jgi:hypothetical protein
MAAGRHNGREPAVFTTRGIVMRRFGMFVGLLLLFATGAMAQEVQGVHPDSTPLQVGVGVTFLNFHEVPGSTVNSAGFTGSAVYRHDDWLGAEGELTDTHGTNSQFLFVGGGVRVYLPTTSDLKPWAHAELGYGHVSPLGSIGRNTSAAYKLGGGFDYNPRHSRIGYRVSANITGSNFFGTYQISPEASVGFVLALGRY